MKISFVDIGFKLRFMLIFCLITLLAVSIASLIFYYLTYREFSNNYGEAFFTLQSVRKAVFPLLFASIQSIALLSFVTIAIGILALLFSHKIAGPLYRFEKSMEIIGSGDLTHTVRVRAGDQILELVKTMNDSIQSVKTKVKETQNALSRLKALEEELNTMIGKGYQEKEIKAVLDKMNEVLNEIKKQL